MKTFRIAAIMVLLAGPVHAQSLGTNIIPDAPAKTPDQIEREQAIERDYKESLKKIPDGKASKDPWGSVRSAETPGAPAKTTTRSTTAGTAKMAPVTRPSKGTSATSQAKPPATPQ